MTRCYLVHAVTDPQSHKALKILKDGYLYSSMMTKEYGLYHDHPLEYVYFSLLCDEIASPTSLLTFFLDTQVLYRRSFRYALEWVGDEISRTKKVIYKYNNIDNVLRKINNHIINIDKTNPSKWTSHEILLKKKVNLKYLVAIYISETLQTPEILEYVKKYYPNVKVLKKFPKSAHELDVLLSQ